jgi:hypothetical protein
MTTLTEAFDALDALAGALQAPKAPSRALVPAKAKPSAPRTRGYSKRELDALIDRLEARTLGR